MTNLSIIIVSWNVQKYLEACLQSLEQAQGDLSIEVFVVDNASEDGTREWLMTYKKIVQQNSEHFLRNKLHLILNSENRGFSAANNQAIKKSTGEYILLLNPDTECTADSFPAMVDFMRRESRCGILGPRLLGSNATQQQSVRRFPNWSALTFLSLGMKIPRVQEYLMEDFDYDKATQVDQVMGACFLIRRIMLEKIGALDEQFFIWFEEVDYCKRAKDAGWQVWYTPATTVVHHGGESFSQVKTLWKQRMFSRSALMYFKKHKQTGDYWSFVFFVPFRLFLSLFRR
jgi:GT2 family glycosyltransferase